MKRREFVTAGLLAAPSLMLARKHFQQTAMRKLCLQARIAWEKCIALDSAECASRCRPRKLPVDCF